MPNAKKKFNVLLSSAGRRVALLDLFRDALRRLGLEGSILAADCSPLSSAWHQADQSFLVPRCDSPDFIPAMLELCEQHSIQLVVPTIDTELMVYAENADQFHRIGTMVSVSSPETIAISNDKVQTHQWFVTHGFPTVNQYVADRLDRLIPELTYPVILKPRYGSSSIGVIQITSESMLRSLWLTVAQPVIEEQARGLEYTINVFVTKKQKCICQVPHRRLEVRHGEVSKGITVKATRLMQMAQAIAEALPGAFGALCFQCFWDQESDRVKFIEINARFGGGFPLAAAAGADFPLWLIQEVLGEDHEEAANAWQDGLLMLRYDAAVFVPEAARLLA